LDLFIKLHILVLMNTIFKKVMGILDSMNTKSVPQKGADFFLEKQEIELVLLIIKDATFKGEQLENLYNVVYKLQQQYLQQTS
jgi:hypothetical protein